MRRFEIHLTFTDAHDHFVANAGGTSEVTDPRKSESDVVQEFAEDLINRKPELRHVRGLQYRAQARQL